jgi:hypothetical protein
MFKITLFFDSGILDENIYTKEIETCSNEKWLQMKKERMLNTWIKRLTDGMELIKDDILRIDVKEAVLQNIINYLNQTDDKNRSLIIDVEKIED